MLQILDEVDSYQWNYALSTWANAAARCKHERLAAEDAMDAPADWDSNVITFDPFVA